MVVKPHNRYIFDNSHQADWRERLGQFFLSPHYSTKGYYKVTNFNTQVIAKTNSIAMQILSLLCESLLIKHIGKALLNSSESYTAKFKGLELQILNQPPVNNANPLFYTAADRWAFLDSVLDVYIKPIDDEAWLGDKASTFLRDELLRIQADTLALKIQNDILLENVVADKGLNDLSNLAQRLPDLETQLKGSHEIVTLAQRLLDLEDKLKNCLEILNARLSEKVVSDDGSIAAEPKQTIGLKNVGNTCYINSAVQPLLAIKDFSDLVPQDIQQKPHESQQHFNGRKAILDSFRSFIQAYNRKEKPATLGTLIGQLRSKIFTAELFEGGFKPEEEGQMQDVGSFLNLILYVIGQNFQLKQEKQFQVPDNQPNRIISENMPNSQVILSHNAGFIQDKIGVFSQVNEGELSDSNLFHHQVGDKEYSLSQYTETTQIVSTPPNVLIFQVKKYKVTPEQDLTINCAPLFGMDEDLTYELSGFAQNHNQAHWTSVVYNDGAWKYCNDDYIKTVTSQDDQFAFPADYLIYKKK